MRRAEMDGTSPTVNAHTIPCDHDDGKTSVVITIDTEPDDAWTNHLNPSVANVAGLMRLHTLLDQYGAKATLLATYRTVQDDKACEVLQTLASAHGAEIGAHLHPWETPPFMESGIDAKYATFPHELPLDVFTQKLRCLTETITQRLTVPTSYRAGRWGLAPQHIAVLEAMGYLCDTSVTPWIDWSDTFGVPPSIRGAGGVDYRRAPLRPYRMDHENVLREGTAALLEIPVTVGFVRPAPAFVWRTYAFLPQLPRRLLRKTGLLRPVWALPAQWDGAHLMGMLRSWLACPRGVLNIACHSSELTLGASPRSRTNEEVDEIFARVAAMLAVLAADRSCVFETLSQAARRWTCNTRRANGEQCLHDDGK